jgi:hypothetical protein
MGRGYARGAAEGKPGLAGPRRRRMSVRAEAGGFGAVDIGTPGLS